MRLFVNVTRDVYDALEEGCIVRIPFNAHWIRRLCYSAKTTNQSDKCWEHDKQECRQCFRNRSVDWCCYPFETVLIRNGERQMEWNVDSVYYDQKSFCVKIKNIVKSKTSIYQNGTK